MTFSNNFHRLETRLQSQVDYAIDDFNMIEDDDTVLVCLFDGEDSYTMLSVLMALQKHVPVDFKLITMSLDRKQPGLPEEVLPNHLKKLGVEYVIIEADTYSIVREKVPEGKTTYSLCSRPRRSTTCRTVKELGVNKIALGHHRDNVVNTSFLNIFPGGKMKSVPPELATDNGDHIVIRPLAYCAEKDIAPYTCTMEFPIIPCGFCSSRENLQHEKVKEILLEWERQTSDHIDSIFASLQDVVPSRLADTDLFDFNGLTTGLAKIGEDALFGQATYDQAPLIFAGSYGDHIEFVRFERKPGNESAEQVVSGEAAAN